MPESRGLRVGLFGFAYLALGIISAIITNPLRSEVAQASLRVGILITAMAVFHHHFGRELGRPPGNPRVPALLAAAAVALGTFLLALYAIGAAWLEFSQVSPALMAALVVWPIATGVPALLAALVLEALRGWVRRRRRGG